MSVNLCHRQRGSALLETALVLPVLLALVIGITDFGRALVSMQAVSAAARAGAEYGALAAGAANDLRQVEEAAILGCGLTGMTAHAATFENEGRRYLRVTTEYHLRTAWRYPGLPGPLPLKGRAVMRIE